MPDHSEREASIELGLDEILPDEDPVVAYNESLGRMVATAKRFQLVEKQMAQDYANIVGKAISSKRATLNFLNEQFRSATQSSKLANEIAQSIDRAMTAKALDAAAISGVIGAVGGGCYGCVKSGETLLNGGIIGAIALGLAGLIITAIGQYFKLQEAQDRAKRLSEEQEAARLQLHQEENAMEKLQQRLLPS